MSRANHKSEKMISLYLQLFLLTGGCYCSEAWFSFIVPARSEYQPDDATGCFPALPLHLPP